MLFSFTYFQVISVSFVFFFFFFFSSRRRHTRCSRDWSSDVCSSDLTFHAGFFGDWDIGVNDNDDVGFTEMGGRLMYQTDSDLRGPYLGTLIVGDAPITGNYFFTKADRKSTRLNSSHGYISYAVFCLKKK